MNLNYTNDKAIFETIFEQIISNAWNFPKANNKDKGDVTLFSYW